MRFVQLTSKASLVVGEPRESEEAILEVTRQKGAVLRVWDRFSLVVQQPLYSLDDFVAMGQERSEELDMRLKRHLAKTLCRWSLFRCKGRMRRFAYHKASPESEAK